MRKRRPPAWTLDAVLPEGVVTLLGQDRTKMLRVLIAWEPLSLDEAARIAGWSRLRAQRTLRGLVDAGFAARTMTSGRYMVNDASSLTAPIIAALGGRNDSLARIRALAAETVSDETSVALHTTADKVGTGVLIVAPPSDATAARELAHVLTAVLPRMLGEPAHVNVTTPSQLVERVEQHDPVAVELWWRSHTVHGPDVAQLMIEIERRRQP